MCDFAGCLVSLFLNTCDGCGGSYCLTHIGRHVHQCRGESSSLASLIQYGQLGDSDDDPMDGQSGFSLVGYGYGDEIEPKVESQVESKVESKVEREDEPAIETGHEQWSEDSVEGSSDDEDGGGSHYELVLLGMMPVAPTPLNVSPTELDTVSQMAGELPTERVAQPEIQPCESTSQALTAPPADAWLKVYHYTCSAITGSVTKLHEARTESLSASFCYLTNEFFSEVSLSVSWGSGSNLVLQALALDLKNRQFFCPGCPRSKLDELVAFYQRDGSAGVRVSLSFKAQVLKLFPPLVKQMFSRARDVRNSSRPDEAWKAEILESFVLNAKKAQHDCDVKVKLLSGEVAFEGIPCLLDTCREEDGAFFLSPRIDLDRLCREGQDALFHELISALVAVDLSRLAFPAVGLTAIPICQQNCTHCFSDYFPVERGAVFLDGLIAKGQSAFESAQSAVEFTLAIQELIRPWLTTANNWTDPCEDEDSQPFQWALARALGKITTDHPMASPMLFLRDLKRHKAVKLHDDFRRLKAQIFLQAGIGHCREFSQVSFSVLTVLAEGDPAIRALLGGIYRCEYEDQDHAFVAGGLDLCTLETGADEDVEYEGKRLDRWSVAVDLCATRRRGWVCDPYLENAEFRSTLWGKHVGFLKDNEDEEPLINRDVVVQKDAEVDLEAILAKQREGESEQAMIALMRSSTPRPLLIRERLFKPCLYVVVSVDWEGTNLHPLNLETIARHHREFAAVKLTHFVCPQYFCDATTAPKIGEYTRDAVTDWSEYGKTPDTSEITALIKSAIGPDDEVGLHIHGWTKLVTGAGVASRYKGEVGPLESRWGDVGHIDYLLDYEPGELKQIVNYALRLLTTHGFPKPTSFRAGGWAGRDELLRAVHAAGIRIDSSMLPASYINELAGTDEALRLALHRIWKGVPDLPQPVVLEPGDGIQIFEVPDGCALADYVSEASMLDSAARAIEKVRAGCSQLFHVGFHQEQCCICYFSNTYQEIDAELGPIWLMREQQKRFEYYNRLRRVFERLTTTDQCEVKFVTVTEAAKIFFGESLQLQ